MYYLYVIKSDAFDRIYIGVSSDIDTRVAQHNARKVFSTKPYVPWRIIYSEVHGNKKSAFIRERQIKKSGLIRKALKEEGYQGPIV
ncbi:MAG TPA: GIY-YIG nuclease family protein [Patescibacteria group bacterium]|nr:GIY-YIG nuclease family protein [Patescibacteria group bacterium]